MDDWLFKEILDSAVEEWFEKEIGRDLCNSLVELAVMWAALHPGMAFADRINYLGRSVGPESVEAAKARELLSSLLTRYVKPLLGAQYVEHNSDFVLEEAVSNASSLLDAKINGIPVRDSLRASVGRVLARSVDACLGGDEGLESWARSNPCARRLLERAGRPVAVEGGCEHQLKRLVELGLVLEAEYESCNGVEVRLYAYIPR